MIELSNRKSIVVSIVIPIIVILLIVASLANSISNTTALANDDTSKSSSSAKTPRQLYDEGYVNHLVQAYIEPQTLALKRGTSQDVKVIINHLSKNKDESITISNLQNPLRNFLPSATSGLTDEEFLDMIAEGKPILGEISVDVSFSESKLVVPASSRAPLTLTVSLPESLPDEIVGKTIEVGISFQVESPSATTSQGGLLTIKVIG